MQDSTGYERPADKELREMLSEEQYEIMVKGGTEAPFTSKYLENEDEGIYVDMATGEPLFTSYDQFESSCGWPSFSQPITQECVKECEDLSHGMKRTEIRSGAGDFHLGHVFDDGPADRGGLRYCINGGAIRFVPARDMEVEGYSYMMPYLKERRKGLPGTPPEYRDTKICGGPQEPCGIE